MPMFIIYFIFDACNCTLIHLFIVEHVDQFSHLHHCKYGFLPNLLMLFPTAYWIIIQYTMAMVMDEIAQELRGGKVVKTRWPQTQRKGAKIDNLSVVLEIENIMPKKVKVGYLSYVREFIPASLLCFKCQRHCRTV